MSPGKARVERGAGAVVMEGKTAWTLTPLGFARREVWDGKTLHDTLGTGVRPAGYGTEPLTARLAIGRPCATCGQASNSPSLRTSVDGTRMDQLPSRISRYEIKTLIGVGGMGALYLARDTNPNTNRLVALKLLNGTLDSHELRERFAREARALAALNHPNIVDIYDSGEFQGSPFIVMEYVRGETLAEMIKRKAPLSLGQKLKLMVELCSGLAHAHEAGIIHRDIKPANLIVDQSGRLKILDFGIARVAEGTRFGPQMTQLNVQIGTPGYMSPEQIEGGEIDRRSDIFAAGAVCYALLAYREAFTGANTRQVENKVLEARPARLSSLVPDLEPAIEEIVSKAMAKDPADRFQDAGAFEEELERERWLLETPVQAPRTTPSPARDSGAGAHDPRAEAAYQRSLAVYEQGAVDAARRFAIEALVEDPDHQDARAFIERLGANQWPPPPPSRSPTTGPTVLADGGGATGTSGPTGPAGPTVLSTAALPAGTVPATSVWARHGKALQIAGIVVGVVLVVALGGLLVVSLWPRGGPLLTVTRPRGGTVRTTGIKCGTDASDCTAHISEGETVQLGAEADPGYVFAGFGGDCGTSGVVRMTRAMTCVATFNPLPKEPENAMRTLTLLKPANGWIVGPGTIRCGTLDSSCSAQFPDGKKFTLLAYADPNFAFRGFTGDCSPTGEIVMTGDRRCAATFVPEQGTPKPSPTPPVTRGGGSGGTGRGGREGAPPSFPPTLPGGNTADPLAPKPDIDPSARVALLSPEELAKKDILQLLEEYRKAYERMDVIGIQRTYPNAPVKTLKIQFSQSYNALTYAFEGPPEFVELDASRGIARVKVKAILTPKSTTVSRVSPYKMEELFTLERKDNGVWLISQRAAAPLK